MELIALLLLPLCAGLLWGFAGAVLLVGSDDGAVTAGTPLVAGARIIATVLGEIKGPKIRIQKYKNKTGYKRRQGFRAKLTKVRVTGIETS